MVKLGNRISVWLCCSVVQVTEGEKGSKDCKKRDENNIGSSGKSTSVLSQMFEEKGKNRSNICIWCSVVEESVAPNHAQEDQKPPPFDMGLMKDEKVVTAQPLPLATYNYPK